MNNKLHDKTSKELVSLVIDLTTKEGISKVLSLVTFTSIPLLYSAIKLYDKIKISQQEEVKIQQQAVEKLIEQGKEQGVDNMQIKINNIKGFKLNLPTDKVQVDTTIGVDKSITLNVKYK